MQAVSVIADYGILNCIRVDLQDMEPFALREIDFELKHDIFEARWEKHGVTDVTTISAYVGRILPTTYPEHVVLVMANVCYSNTQMLHALHAQTGMPWILSVPAVEESNRKIREYLYTAKLMFVIAFSLALYAFSFQQLP